MRMAVSDLTLEAELNLKMAMACNPALHTECHRQAMNEWHEANSYNDQRVPYLEMTADQRRWVDSRQREMFMERNAKR